MDGRGSGGGGCIARYSGSSVGGCGDGCYGDITCGMSKVERIMLKFRPIAPKPMADGSGSSSSTVEHSDGSGGTRRKRRYVRVNSNKKKNSTNTIAKKRKVSTFVTLALMPETPDRKENSHATSSPSENKDLLSFSTTINPKKPLPVLLSFNYNNNNKETAREGHVIALQPQKKAVVTSCVTVECVTETWNMNGEGLGFTDQARVMSMEMDTCPSFITNSRDMVVWTNKAYREMMCGGCGGGSDETTVVVVKKVNRVTMPVSHPGFTCNVKVTWGMERGAAALSVTAPCDVWRLRTGGYAWRLDVTAALTLGRYT